VTASAHRGAPVTTNAATHTAIERERAELRRENIQLKRELKAQRLELVMRVASILASPLSSDAQKEDAVVILVRAQDRWTKEAA
jgi:hypothetical protein